MRATDRTGLAIILSLVALTLFDAMGLIIKHLSEVYSAAELSAWRNLFGLIPSIIALWTSKVWHKTGRRLKIRQWKLALLRGAVVTFAQLSFYMALGLMAFATASTITYASALFTTALAIPILGERVGWVRWCGGAEAVGDMRGAEGMDRDAADVVGVRFCVRAACVCVRGAAGNIIGPTAGAAVAEALKLNSTLTILNLNCKCGRWLTGGLCHWWAGGTGWG